MAGTPVTQDDLDSVAEVPSEEALRCLEVLRAAQHARLAQEAAELRLTTAEQRAVDALVALDALEVSISGQQARGSTA